MTGGLFDPLGQHRTEPAARRPAAVYLAALALAAAATLIAVAFLRDDGDRGRPVAVVPIEHVEAPKAPPPPSPPPPAAAAPAAPQAAGEAASPPGLPPVGGDQEVDIENGVRVIRPRRSAPGPGSLTLPVPPASR